MSREGGAIRRERGWSADAHFFQKRGFPGPTRRVFRRERERERESGIRLDFVAGLGLRRAYGRRLQPHESQPVLAALVPRSHGFCVRGFVFCGPRRTAARGGPRSAAGDGAEGRGDSARALPLAPSDGPASISSSIAARSSLPPIFSDVASDGDRLLRGRSRDPHSCKLSPRRGSRKKRNLLALPAREKAAGGREFFRAGPRASCRGACRREPRRMARGKKEKAEPPPRDVEAEERDGGDDDEGHEHEEAPRIPVTARWMALLFEGGGRRALEGRRSLRTSREEKKRRRGLYLECFWEIAIARAKETTDPQVVTGFLGAGKTTLINYILKGDHGMKARRGHSVRGGRSVESRRRNKTATKICEPTPPPNEPSRSS